MNKGLNRNTIDKFYTNQETVKLCINLVKKYLNIPYEDVIIEPSAGNGAFIDEIKRMVKYYYFYDIKPEKEEIIKMDFLELIPPKGRLHMIGNPPFGRQSSLAIKFIKKSCLIAESISFILPKSFKKDSMKKYFSMNFHLIHEEDIQENSFLLDGKICNVETVFQIWEKKDFNRQVPDILEPIGFKFVSKLENPDIAFRRVGVNAGNISRVIEDKNTQTHYFIKFEGNIENYLKKIEKITFEHGNTVGPKSIGKQELIKKYNNIL